MRLPGFGEEKQVLLKNAHVMVIGLGGLGNPVAQYLAAAGIGKLTLVDHDRIELHNIHRQPLFGIQDVGHSKADVASKKLKELYPAITFESIFKRFDTESAKELTEPINMIADCTDNFNSRYAIDSVAFSRKTPVLFGAIHLNEGRLSLFHGNAGTRYTDAYPRAPFSNIIRDCEAEGILGPHAGVIGSMMAAAIVTFLTTGESYLDGSMLHIDLRNFKTVQFQIPTSRDAATEIRAFTSLEARPSNLELIRSGGYELIDVREWHEHAEFNIGGRCLPAGNIREWLGTLNPELTTLLYCSHGHQSSIVAQYISTLIPTLHIAHLQGGLEAWNALMKEEK